MGRADAVRQVLVHEDQSAKTKNAAKPLMMEGIEGAPSTTEMHQILSKAAKSRKESLELIEKRRLEAKKVEEVPAFAGIKLNKASVIKRGWDDKQLEVVELKSHKFEDKPLDEPQELVSAAWVSEPLIELSVDDDGQEADVKMKKKKRKKLKPPKREEPEFTAPKPRLPSPEQEVVKLDQIKLKPPKKISIEEDKGQESTTRRESLVSEFAEVKLKKTETVKSTWEDATLEDIDLKHHDVEPLPESEEVR